MSVSEKTSVIERLTKPAHLIDMEDIIRAGFDLTKVDGSGNKTVRHRHSFVLSLLR